MALVNCPELVPKNTQAKKVLFRRRDADFYFAGLEFTGMRCWRWRFTTWHTWFPLGKSKLYELTESWYFTLLDKPGKWSMNDLYNDLLNPFVFLILSLVQTPFGDGVIKKENWRISKAASNQPFAHSRPTVFVSIRAKNSRLPSAVTAMPTATDWRRHGGKNITGLTWKRGWTQIGWNRLIDPRPWRWLSFVLITGRCNRANQKIQFFTQ